MSFFQKTMLFVLFVTIILVITAENNLIIAQLSSEQQEQINQYKIKIKDCKSSNQLKMAASYSNKCASIYLMAGDYQDAINSYVESAQINDQIGNDLDNKKIYNNIAMIYSEMDQLKNTLKYFEKSLLISRRYNNKKEIAVSLMDISTILISDKEYDKAIKNLNEALDLSQDINDLNNLRSCYNLMSQAYKAAGDVKKSDEYYKYYLAYDKKIREGDNTPENFENNFLSAESENLHEVKTEKKTDDISLNLNKEIHKTSIDSINHAIEISKAEEEHQLEILNADNKLNETKIKGLQKINEANKIFIVTTIIGIFIIIILILTGIYLLQKKQKQIRQLEEKLAQIEKSKSLN